MEMVFRSMEISSGQFQAMPRQLTGMARVAHSSIVLRWPGLRNGVRLISSRVPNGLREAVRHGLYVVPLSLVTSPTATAMVVECSSPMGSFSRYFDNYGLIPHTGGMNVLYFDGHVEWLAFAQIPRSTTDVFWIGR